MSQAAEEEVGSAISGSIGIPINTNFMSYGRDIWQSGNFNDWQFNPTGDLSFDLGVGFNVFGGIWMDINDNIEKVSGGSNLQEVDVWVGFGYQYEKFSTSIAYQSWIYGGDQEMIMDFIFGYDTILNPSFQIHARVKGNDSVPLVDGDNPAGVGRGTQDVGAVFILGIEEGFDLGPVAFSFPFQVGFITSEYYVEDESGGFGYVNLGVNTSVPLSFIPARFGSWSWDSGATYWYTDPNKIGNVDIHGSDGSGPFDDKNHILAMTTGISLSF